MPSEGCEPRSDVTCFNWITGCCLENRLMLGQGQTGGVHDLDQGLAEVVMSSVLILDIFSKLS